MGENKENANWLTVKNDNWLLDTWHAAWDLKETEIDSNVATQLSRD